jgi:hypothetical protein
MTVTFNFQRKSFGIVAVFTFVALLIPGLVAAVPPLSDYPNHLSRFWLLAGGARVPPVSGMYQVIWDTFTNIGTDLVAVMLAPVFRSDTMGRFFVEAAVLLTPIGGVVLWRVLHGRFHWWQLSFGLLAWNLGLILGFLNFEIGIGLALLAAAADPALSRRGPAVSVISRALLGGIILVLHALAFVFYAALLYGIIVGPELHPLLQRGTVFRIGRAVLAATATLAVPALLFLLLTRSLPGKQGGADMHTVLLQFQQGFSELRTAPGHKLSGLFVGIVAYANWLDALTLAALALPVFAALLFGRLKTHAGLLLLAGILLACYLACPAGLMDAWYVDSRFALMVPLVLAVALQPELPRWPAGMLAAFLLIVSLTKTSAIAWIWHERQADVASVSRALALVPPGAALLPLEHQGRMPDGGPPGRYLTSHLTSYGHLPTLAVPWRHAFVPTLFAIRGQQPVQVLPPWNQIADPTGGFLASVHALDMPEVYAASLDTAPYLKFWRERFDYALVLNADVPDEHGPFVPVKGMRLVSDDGFAQLYQISRPVPMARNSMSDAPGSP